MRIDFFGVPMTVAAVGFMLQAAFYADFETESAYKTFGLFAACIFVLLFTIYVIKALLWPKKVWKEWCNPLAGNFFSTISITLVLEGILLMPSGLNAGVTLVWIGSVLQKLITVLSTNPLLRSISTLPYCSQQLGILSVL